MSIVIGVLHIEGGAYFLHNRAQEGGAIYVLASTVSTNFMQIHFENNTEGALAIYSSDVIFEGMLILSNNIAHRFSPLHIDHSSVTFKGTTQFMTTLDF